MITYRKTKSGLVVLLLWMMLGCRSLPTASESPNDSQDAHPEEVKPEPKTPKQAAPPSPPASEDARPAPKEELPATSLPSAPKIPLYQWQAYPRIDALMIPEKQWQAIVRYSQEWQVYLQKMEKILLEDDPSRRLPAKPRWVTPTFTPVPSQDVTAKDRNQRHLSTSKAEAKALDTFIQDTQRYVILVESLLS